MIDIDNVLLYNYNLLPPPKKPYPSLDENEDMDVKY